MGEAVTDERLTTIILDALTQETYSTVKMQSIRDPELGLEAVMSMTKTTFIIYSERSSVPKWSQESYGKVRNSGCEPRTDNVRESAMALTYHNF